MPKRHYRQLSYEERIIICHQHRQGQSAGSIAKQLKRATSTITRELQRNKFGQNAYYPMMADRKRQQRRYCKRVLMANESLRTLVIERLKQSHSPQQVAQGLALEQSQRIISYETIYRFIYDPTNRDLKLWQHLRFNKKPTRRVRGHRRSRSRILQRVSIHARAPEVNQRAVFGHWEGDLVLFQRSTQKNFLVLRERQTRFTVVFINTGRSSQAIIQQLLDCGRRLPKGAVRSMTFDNDLCFAAHARLQTELGINTYF